MTDSTGQTRHLAQRVRSALRDKELRAIDALFQLGCRRSERHLDVLRDFEWSRLPRTLEFGLGSVRDWNCDQIREAGRAFLMAAIEDILATNGRTGSELEVLRAMQARLEGVPAQQLGEVLENDPQKRRDPKTYRNWIVAYGYEQIREWARGGSIEAAVVDKGVGPVSGWMRWTAAGIVLVAVVVMLYVANRPDLPDSSVVDPGSSGVLVPLAHVGVHLEAPNGSPVFPHIDETLDVTELPNLGSRVWSAVLVPRSETLRAAEHEWVPLDSVLVALGTDLSGTNPGCVALWDAAADTVLWEYRFEQRPGEADMNADLPPDAGQQPYRVRWLVHSSRAGSLGPDRLLAVFQQKFSPTFAVFLDLQTGRELARYASYGHLDSPIVVDLEGDGRAEVLFAGTDNRCDAATLTVLDPWMSDGASSSVSWNDPGEGARWRVVFPDPRSLLDGYFASIDYPTWDGPAPPRLHTWDLGIQSWDPRSGRLELSVGGSPIAHAYQVTLVRGRPSEDVPVIRLGDSNEAVWRSLGLDPSVDPARLEERIVVIEQGAGYGCPEGMEKADTPEG